MSYNIIPKLSKLQEQKIKKRIKLDFFKELDFLDKEKENFSKNFSKQMENLVNFLDKKGVLFYSIIIKLPYSTDKFHFWEEVHKDVEEFINYIGFNIELVEFCYIATELENRNPIWQKKINDQPFFFPKLSCVIGVRSILGKNQFIIHSLLELFRLSFYDIEVKSFHRSYDVIKYWNFIISQFNFKFHSFVNYSQFYPYLYGCIADEELKFEGNFAFGQADNFISSTKNIKGINEKFPSKKKIFLYFLYLFIYNNNNYIFYENIFYEKLEKSKITWKIIFKLYNLKSDFSLIFNSVQSMYPQQLGDFDADFFYDLNLNFLRKKSLSLALINNLEKFDRIVEFKNGIFFIDKSIFLSFDEIELSELKKLKTFIFIDKDFYEIKLNIKLLNKMIHKYDYDYKDFENILIEDIIK